MRDLRIDRWVTMPGQSECLEAFYQTADLFVIDCIKGLPTVMIEALGFGLPIVSTDCPWAGAILYRTVVRIAGAE